MKNYISLFALLIAATINAQNQGTKTIFTENFGFLDTNESISANSSIYSHTGTGDFIHKIINTQGASNSKCFGQLDSSGASSASLDIQDLHQLRLQRLYLLLRQHMLCLLHLLDWLVLRK